MSPRPRGRYIRAVGSYRPHHDEVARVEVGAERETPSGWSYDVTVDWPEGVETAHRVTLSWADHDHVSGGAVAPSVVVETMLEVLVRAMDADHLPRRIDLATMRRVVEDLDERIRARL